MMQILIGSLVLSIVHASIPNHWLPLVAIGKTEEWSVRDTIGVTFITGMAHTLSTILIGVLVGVAGYALSTYFATITGWVAPGILVILGVLYLLWGMRQSYHHHHFDQLLKSPQKSKTSIVLSLSIAMFFSPCIEIEAYYFVAGNLGWEGIIAVSLIYTIITIAGMLLLVWLGMKGVRKIKSRFLEHHEKTITGVLLIVLGIAGYFIS